MILAVVLGAARTFRPAGSGSFDQPAIEHAIAPAVTTGWAATAFEPQIPMSVAARREASLG